MKKHITTLVIVLAILSHIGNVFAAEETIPTFNCYLADYTINNSSLYDFYKNDYYGIYRNYVDNGKKNPAFWAGLVTWEIVTFQLSDIAEENNKRVGFYETILYDVMYQGNMNEPLSDTYKEIVSSVKANSLKKLSKYMEKDPVPTLESKIGNLSEDDKAMLSQTLQTAEELTSVFEAIGKIETVIGYVNTVEELIDKLAKTEAIIDRIEQNKATLQNMKQSTTNSAFISAIDNMMLVCDEQLTFEQVKNYFVAETTARELSELVLKSVWKFVLKNLNGYGLALSAGQAGGKLMSNALFSTDENLELYYSLNALAEYEDAMKAALNIAEKNYIKNPTDENAVAFNEAYKLLLQTHILGVEAAKKVVVFENESGLVNSLITLLTKDDYSKAVADLDELKAGMTKTLSTLYGNVYNLYIKQYGAEAEALGLLPKTLPTDEEYNSAYTFLSNFSSDAKGVTFSKDYTLTEDRTIYGNVSLTGGTLNLNGFKLTVAGNLTQTGGKLNVGNGMLKVGGNYRAYYGIFDAGSGRTEVGGDFIYTSGDTSSFVMTQDEAYVLVYGNFEIDTRYNRGNIKAGTMEFKGNFTQKDLWETFPAEGTHKVIFSGDGEQLVSFESTSSCFNILESKNDKLYFETVVVVNEIRGNSMFDTLKIQNTTFSDGVKVNVANSLHSYGYIDMNNASIFVGGNLNLNSDITLNNSTLSIKGGVNQNKGKLNVGNGMLKVGGNYRAYYGIFDAGSGRTEVGGDFIYTSGDTSSFVMTQDEAYVLVYGNFEIDTRYNRGNIKAGTMEFKGNFTQKDLWETFPAEGTHKVIFSGDGEQLVSFESTSSYFNSIINRNPNGVIFCENIKFTEHKIEYPIFDISFVTNCATLIEPTQIAYGEFLEKPQVPSNVDLNFVGWYVDEELTTPYDFDAEVRKDLVLYAKWSDELFAFNEATYSVDNRTIFASVDIADELQEKNGIVIIAVYNGDSFADVYYTDVIGTVNHTFNSIDAIENSYTIKAFCLSDLEKIIPLCESISTTVQ